ncbi:sulfatase [Leptospira sp. 96542]|nr:sulfatase [Leptospira sp. 96542]
MYDRNLKRKNFSFSSESHFPNWFQMRTKGQIVTFLIFCITACSETKQPKVQMDLVLDLKQAKSKFELGTDLLAYHWKKNPGRHSNLPSQRKWENTQITFNTNKTIFLNHSIDALYFPPGQSYLFQTKPGKFFFSSMIGLLGEFQNQKNMEGTLFLKSAGEVVWSWDANGKTPETWFEIQNKIEIQSTLELVWESKKSHLFVGEPLLIDFGLETRTEKPSSVVLIVIDSARKDFFGVYGYPHSVTPFMDGLANESVVFENPFANGNWTKPSMMSFFHSEYSSNLGLGNSWFTTKAYQRKVYYGKKRDNLAKTFRELGYYSKSIMNNVFFLDYTTVGLDLGFHNSYQVGMDILDTEELTNHAIDFVKAKKDIPFFLHFNLNTPHASYSPPPEDMEAVKKIIPSSVFSSYESPIKRYLGELHYTDREIKRFVQTLKETGIYDNTLIIVTGDHGELFSPWHDYSYHFIMQTRFGHGETHYDEEINVPYFIKLPKTVTVRGSQFPFKISGQSSLLSLAPTILGLLDVKPKTSTYQGVDYSDCIRYVSNCPEEKYIYTEGRMSESMRTESYKYIRRYPGFTTVRRTAVGEPHSMGEELYDLSKDPEERTNLSVLPEGKELLEVARNEFRNQNFLKRNSLKLYVPPCFESSCFDSVSFQIQGSIYDWDLPKSTTYSSSSAKTIQLQKQSAKTGETIVLKTVNPEMGANFQFYRNGKTIPVRFGRYGLEFKSTFQKIEDLITSERVPLGFTESELPWVYNDGAFSGAQESEQQKEMGKEVKKILETWGYIHE